MDDVEEVDEVEEVVAPLILDLFQEVEDRYGAIASTNIASYLMGSGWVRVQVVSFGLFFRFENIFMSEFASIGLVQLLLRCYCCFVSINLITTPEH